MKISMICKYKGSKVSAIACELGLEVKTVNTS
jgi:hypothetical protein